MESCSSNSWSFGKKEFSEQGMFKKITHTCIKMFVLEENHIRSVLNVLIVFFLESVWLFGFSEVAP